MHINWDWNNSCDCTELKRILHGFSAELVWMEDGCRMELGSKIVIWDRTRNETGVNRGLFNSIKLSTSIHFVASRKVNSLNSYIFKIAHFDKCNNSIQYAMKFLSYWYFFLSIFNHILYNRFIELNKI